MEKPRPVHVNLTEDQYNLLRRRVFTEHQTVQAVVSALVNAYIMGDVSVTPMGRYTIHPPSTHPPVIEIEKGDKLVEVEPNWGISSDRPQVGHGDPRQRPKERYRDRWGTRELADYLRAESGRRISLQNLRRLLRTIDTPKDGERWYFSGPEDPKVQTVLAHIREGTYDALAQEGVVKAREHSEAIRKQIQEKQEADKLTDEQRRIQHLRRLRKIQEF